MADEKRPMLSFLRSKQPDTYDYPPESYDYTRLPDIDRQFLPAEHLAAFANALSAPDPTPAPDDALTSAVRSSIDRSSINLDYTASGSTASLETIGQTEPVTGSNGAHGSTFISARNDWAPVNHRVKSERNRKKKKKAKLGSRTVDETREGYLYTLLKWPFLIFVLLCIIGLSITYILTRTYIFLYEQCVTWTGRRERLRRKMRATNNYNEWVRAAKQLDSYLGNQDWKEENEFAYYNSATVRRVYDQIRKHRRAAEEEEARGRNATSVEAEKSTPKHSRKRVDDLKALVEACVKNNFVGVENSRLYSQTYYGTKNLVQKFIDEGTDIACFQIRARLRTSWLI